MMVQCIIDFVLYSSCRIKERLEVSLDDMTRAKDASTKPAKFIDHKTPEMVIRAANR